MIRPPVILVLLLLIVAGSTSIFAQDAGTYMKEAVQLEASFKDAEALNKFLQVLSVEPNNLQALCKTSELYNRLGKRQPTKDKQKQYYRYALSYAKKALALNSSSPDANFVMAGAMGRMAMISSGDDRIKAVKDIKYYADRCVQLDPSNYKGMHVLGKWHYEVSDLNAFERWLVRVTYGGLPAASLDEAIRYYEKSIQINSGFLLNYLELAKAYKRKSNNPKAIALLQAVLKMPSVISDDAQVKSEAAKLLKSIED